MNRFVRAAPSHEHEDSYNVVNMNRTNCDGKPYVLHVALTREQAAKLADKLNQEHEEANEQFSRMCAGEDSFDDLCMF